MVTYSCRKTLFTTQSQLCLNFILDILKYKKYYQNCLFLNKDQPSLLNFVKYHLNPLGGSSELKVILHWPIHRSLHHTPVPKIRNRMVVWGLKSKVYIGMIPWEVHLLRLGLHTRLVHGLVTLLLFWMKNHQMLWMHEFSIFRSITTQINFC